MTSYIYGAIYLWQYLLATVADVPARGLSRTRDGKRNQFGPRLRALRLEAGMTQAQVAAALQRLKPQAWDCEVIVYSTVERQLRSLSDIELVAILRVLGKTVKDL